STGGSLACTQGMRVRFPSGPPGALSINGRSSCSHREDAGSIPASATSSVAGKPKKPRRWAHDPEQAGASPVPPTTSPGVRPTEGPRYYKPQTRVRLLHSAPVDGERRQTVRREAVNLAVMGSTPIAHPNGT